jgi:hypothetical protein
MLRRPALALLVLVSPFAAGAQGSGVFVELWAGSGGIPTDQSWSVNLVIRLDGRLTLKNCLGDGPDGPTCMTAQAGTTAERLDAIRSAVADADLVSLPTREAIGAPVGGVTIYLDDVRLTFPAYPSEADAPRVRPVLSAIMAAVP